MPLIANTTFNSSDPILVVDGGCSGAPSAPNMFWVGTTAVSSAVANTAFLPGAGFGGRAANPGIRPGSILVHTQLTTAGVPLKATLHVCIATTANVASTVASSGWGAMFDCSFALAT